MEQIIKYIAILVVLAIIYRIVSSLLFKYKPKKQEYLQKANVLQMEESKKQADTYDYSHSYQRKWLLTENEKNAYQKIKPITDELGLTIFTKVRLFDLLEPKPGIDNFKGAMWKIQAKHVDFVICNQYLDPKLVIELDDSSHQRKDRQERDEFVDAILTNTGYPILHANYINPEKLRELFKTEVLGINAESQHR